MKFVPLLRIALLQFCFVPNLFAQEEAEPSLLSPDGRFVFEAFSPGEVEAGKRPNFGIIERASGKLVSDPQEPLGDASRPGESILWAPDSRSYALTSRVGTRHLDTFLYRWNGKAFVRATWEEDGTLESRADAEVVAMMRRLGFTDEARRGQTIAGDGLAERWLDPHRLILTDVQECLAGEGDREEVVNGMARAIVRWDETAAAYRIERFLEVAPPAVPEIGETAPFTVVQTDLPGADPNARRIEVHHREKGEVKSLEAENWMTSPSVKVEENGWPQIELISRGPAGFFLRRLYRVMDGEYRCHRIEEVTRLAHQAPEGAPLVEAGAGNSFYLIRSRRLNPGDSDTCESFQTETLSPDGEWKTVFTYTPQYLHRVEIVGAKEATEPVVIYDFESGDASVDAVCRTVWRPDSGAFAFSVQEGPRVGHTLLYRRVGRVWSEAPMPEIDYGFLKAAIESGATRGHRHETPLWWNGGRELALELTGFFKGEEGITYRAIALLRWDENGDPAGSETISE